MRYHFSFDAPRETYVVDSDTRTLWPTSAPEDRVQLTPHDVDILDRDIDLFYLWLRRYHDTSERV